MNNEMKSAIQFHRNVQVLSSGYGMLCRDTYRSLSAYEQVATSRFMCTKVVRTTSYYRSKKDHTRI